MTRVVWTQAALIDLEQVLNYIAERSRQGAATVAAGIRQSIMDIETLPRAARRDPATGIYERNVRGAPLLLIYDLVIASDGETQAEIIAVFHTARDPDTKPRRT